MTSILSYTLGQWSVSRTHSFHPILSLWIVSMLKWLLWFVLYWFLVFILSMYYMICVFWCICVFFNHSRCDAISPRSGQRWEVQVGTAWRPMLGYSHWTRHSKRDNGSSSLYVDKTPQKNVWPRLPNTKTIFSMFLICVILFGTLIFDRQLP